MKSTLLGVLAVAAATGMMFGASCAGRNDGPAACPGGGWCATAIEAGTVAEPSTGTTFTCPIGVRSAVAAESGAALPAGMPAGAKGTLDERTTRAKRKAGDAITCCYVWNDPCPA
ncbi:MAG: hypothetical protein H0T76_18880 [Nannocystis sp.]|nr:hypothetical protein [Nannocystis sp.]MBA3548553.1 hypothetical protein [Nannocystis sp.]